jgi:hypothetical protein
MTTAAANSILNQSAIDVCKSVPLDERAREFLAKSPTVGQLISVLKEAGLLADACSVLAFALPKREAIWWACQCIRKADVARGPKDKAALEAAESWVTGPDEPRRRAAHVAAEATGAGTPTGCAALAVFLSGGSLAPAELTEVPPAEHLTAVAVKGAVALAAVAGEASKALERFNTFLTLGQEIAAGKSKWPVN